MSINKEQGRRPGESVSQIVPRDCKKPLGLGLHGEDLTFQVRPAERHFNGAKAFRDSERAYHGGSSAADIIDKLDL